MQLEVLVFGQVATTIAADRIRIEVAASADEHASSTVHAVLAALDEQHPEIRFALPAARIAVNHAFATADTRVTARDELALISLVGGG